MNINFFVNYFPMNIKMAYFTNQEKFFNLLIKKFYQNE